jgi:hypothetical protein
MNKTGVSALVERIAIALKSQFDILTPPASIAWEDCDESSKDYWRAMARTALLAIAAGPEE